MDFINLKRGRRLVPVSSLSWEGTYNAGYEPELGATAVELPYQDGEFSLILVLPGKISEFVAGITNYFIASLSCSKFYFSLHHIWHNSFLSRKYFDNNFVCKRMIRRAKCFQCRRFGKIGGETRREVMEQTAQILRLSSS